MLRSLGRDTFAHICEVNSKVRGERPISKESLFHEFYYKMDANVVQQDRLADRSSEVPDMESDAKVR